MDKQEKKIYIFAGESSGDIYGAKLATEAKRIAEERGVNLRISGMGGERMAKAGVDLQVDSTELGVVGIFEILKMIHVFIKIYFKLVKMAKTERPDAVVLIDYPGFNLAYTFAMARLNIPVIWYVSPQIWVWGKWRKKHLERLCRKMLVIFPFETEVYNREILNVEFVGHPLLEIIDSRIDRNIVRDERTFVLLPGSRSSEITRLLTPMLDVVREIAPKHPELEFVISAPREKMAKLCEKILNKYRKKHKDLPEIKLTCGTTRYYQQKAAAGLAASGTVTVESALTGLPLVVIYKMNFFTALLALVLVKLYRGFFTMVNIILNKEVFQEFAQYKVNNKNLVPAVEAILPGGSRRKEVEADMIELRRVLSSDHKPSESAAIAVLDEISKADK